MPNVALSDSPCLEFWDALRLAESKSLQLAAQRAAIDAAQQAVLPAGLRPAPELMIGLENLPITGDDAWRVNREDMTMRSIGIEQMWMRRSKRVLSKQRAELEVQIEQAKSQTERQQLRERVAMAWIDRWQAEQQLALLAEEQGVLNLKTEAAVARARVRMDGSMEALSSMQARVALADRLAQTNLAREQAIFALQVWLGDAANQALGAPPDWQSLPLLPSQTNSRIESHREWQSVAAQQNLSNLNIEQAKAELQPDWSSRLSYGNRGGGMSDLLSLEWRVALPWNRRNRQLPAIEMARARDLELQRNLEFEQQRLHFEWLAMEREWKNASERVARWDQQLIPLLKAQIDLTQARYRGGTGSLDEALMAQREAINMRMERVEAVTQLARAWARLRFIAVEEPTQ